MNPVTITVADYKNFNKFEMKGWRVNGPHSVSSFPRQVNEIVIGLLATEILIKNTLDTYSSHLRGRMGKQGHILWELIVQSTLILTKGKPWIQCWKTTAETPGRWQPLSVSSSQLQVLSSTFWDIVFSPAGKKTTYDEFQTTQSSQSYQILENNQLNDTRDCTSNLQS